MNELVERLVSEIAKRKKSILVIGDTMIDRWIHGHTAQCQDGCTKFVQESVVDTPGGAYNAEHCLVNWGVRTALYGFAQNDCPIKSRYVDENNRIVFRADDDGPAVRGAGYEWSRKLALEMIPFSMGVLLSDYDKGFLTPEFIRQASELCHNLDIPCVADCKRSPDLYANCILKGNLDWMEKWIEHPHSTKWVVTRGGVPPIVSGVSEYDYQPQVSCTNHVGAGDCFASHLTLALACGFSLEDAAALAHSAGRVYVQHPHNRSPYPHEIAADMVSAVVGV